MQTKLILPFLSAWVGLVINNLDTSAHFMQSTLIILSFSSKFPFYFNICFFIFSKLQSLRVVVLQFHRNDEWCPCLSTYALVTKVFRPLALARTGSCPLFWDLWGESTWNYLHNNIPLSALYAGVCSWVYFKTGGGWLLNFAALAFEIFHSQKLIDKWKNLGKFFNVLLNSWKSEGKLLHFPWNLKGKFRNHFGCIATRNARL